MGGFRNSEAGKAELLQINHFLTSISFQITGKYGKINIRKNGNANLEQSRLAFRFAEGYSGIGIFHSMCQSARRRADLERWEVFI